MVPPHDGRQCLLERVLGGRVMAGVLVIAPCLHFDLSEMAGRLSRPLPVDLEPALKSVHLLQARHREAEMDQLAGWFCLAEVDEESAASRAQ